VIEKLEKDRRFLGLASLRLCSVADAVQLVEAAPDEAEMCWTDLFVMEQPKKDGRLFGGMGCLLSAVDPAALIEEHPNESDVYSTDPLGIDQPEKHWGLLGRV
jgi:hypothetical protein